MTAIPAPSRARDGRDVLDVLDVRALQRQLAAQLPNDVAARSFAAGGPSLEISPPAELPRLIAAPLLEDDAMRARAVPSRGADSAAPVFAAFLDGTQASRAFAYADGLPLVHGRVAAVVRERRDRRLSTWRHTVAARVYAARRWLPRVWNDALDSLGIEVVDTFADALSASGDAAPEHPFAVRDAAMQQVKNHRGLAERELAEAWCRERDGELLFVDGGISASERLASHGGVVGVIKSHRTLYAEGGAMQTVLALGAGERSSVFRVTSPKRAAVASWYLRLRDARGREPMWGLVRVEVSLAGRAPLGARADEISAAILREAAPAALPDPRWHAMAYGIRDCEEFLRALG
jgi:hypothetical protein